MITYTSRKTTDNARVAQLVERDLAKVEAAGSSPVSRSSEKESEYRKINGFRLSFCLKIL